MKITTRPYGTTTVLDIDGRFDITAKAQVEKMIEKAKTGDCSHLILNLQGVEMIDSTAVGLLVLTHQAFKDMHRQMSLIQPSGLAKTQLDVLNIKTVIPVYESEEALNAHTLSEL